MSLIVLLDAGPLGMVTNPKSSPENEACKNWLAALADQGIKVVIPEIADYEVRRELLRAGNVPRTWPLGRIEGHARVCAHYDAGDVEGRGVLGGSPKVGAAISR